MKRTNKKGFTIVELVIVIAVIAILAAVLIPTFGGVIEKAQKSANEQDAANTYKQLIAEDKYLGNLNLNTTSDTAVDLYIVVEDNTTADEDIIYEVVNGKIALSTVKDVTDIANTYEALTANDAKLNGNYTNVYVYVGVQQQGGSEGN